jgi:hypothetical protein
LHVAKKRAGHEAAQRGRKGPVGARGLKGVRGRRGPKGFAGPRGKVGAAGTRGRKGATGPAEDNRLLAIAKSVEDRFADVYRELNTQLRRIAQLQADLDSLKIACGRLKSGDT